MLNRRLIRIKVFQVLYGELVEESLDLKEILQKARKSILEIEQHFMDVLTFLPEFRHLILSEHNPSDLKINPTAEDKNAFSLFESNPHLDALEKIPAVKKHLDKPHIRWADERDLIFLIYKQVRQHDTFIELRTEAGKDESQFDFMVFLYKFLIKESVEFEQFMEEKNILWYDEKIPILKSFERFFETFKNSKHPQVPEISRNLEEDISFAEQLLSQYQEHKSELFETINTNTPGWDSDRITRIDFVLMSMALCEFKHLPFVPVKVTINEYIEIAKMYSTPLSSKFINGTLDKILKEWQQGGLINKSGRGLIG